MSGNAFNPTPKMTTLDAKRDSRNHNYNDSLNNSDIIQTQKQTRVKKQLGQARVMNYQLMQGQRQGSIRPQRSSADPAQKTATRPGTAPKQAPPATQQPGPQIIKKINIQGQSRHLSNNFGNNRPMSPYGKLFKNNQNRPIPVPEMKPPRNRSQRRGATGSQQIKTNAYQGGVRQLVSPQNQIQR